jgi:hypothetical protein
LLARRRRVVGSARFSPAAPAPDGASTPAVFVLPSVAPATKLEKIILSKEAKVPSYRQGCQGVWLLIVAHGFEPSTHCDLAPEAEDYEFETGFDRVFFLHHSNEFVTYG